MCFINEALAKVFLLCQTFTNRGLFFFCISLNKGEIIPSISLCHESSRSSSAKGYFNCSLDNTWKNLSIWSGKRRSFSFWTPVLMMGTKLCIRCLPLRAIDSAGRVAVAIQTAHKINIRRRKNLLLLCFALVSS